MAFGSPAGPCAATGDGRDSREPSDEEHRKLIFLHQHILNLSNEGMDRPLVPQLNNILRTIAAPGVEGRNTPRYPRGHRGNAQRAKTRSLYRTPTTKKGRKEEGGTEGRGKLETQTEEEKGVREDAAGFSEESPGGCARYFGRRRNSGR